MKRFLIARMDGTAESGFALGAIVPATGVPVTLNFDHEQVVGKADITVEGANVYATLTDRRLLTLDGLYPAVGGRSEEMSFHHGVVIFNRFDLVCVSLCHQPNADPYIPPIGEVH